MYFSLRQQYCFNISQLYHGALWAATVMVHVVSDWWAAPVVGGGGTVTYECQWKVCQACTLILVCLVISGRNKRKKVPSLNEWKYKANCKINTVQNTENNGIHDFHIRAWMTILDYQRPAMLQCFLSPFFTSPLLVGFIFIQPLHISISSFSPIT